MLLLSDPIAQQIKLAGIFLETHVEKVARQAMLHLDQHKMEQVLRNYISNAIKFTPCGGHIDVYVNLYVTPPTFPLQKSTPEDCCGGEYKESPPVSSPLHHFNRTQESPSHENTWVRVSVTDTGPGVAQVWAILSCYVLFILSPSLCRKIKTNFLGNIFNLMLINCKKVVALVLDCGVSS